MSQWWRVALLGLAVLLLGGCTGGVQPTATALPSMTATSAGGASAATLSASSTPHPATATSAPPASPAATPVGAMCAPGVSFLGFSDALDKQQFQQTDIGGLSALVYAAPREAYYALVDNERETPARFYTLRFSLAGGQLSAPQVTAVTTLRDTSGTPYTGRNFDGEGMALLPDDTLLIASETEPAIRRFALDGRQLAELSVPQRFLVAPRGEAQGNGTFESLALTPNGQSFYTAVEEPLAPDGSASDGKNRLRILRYDRQAGGTFTTGAQFFYLAEARQGVSDMAALNDQELLVLERGYVPLLGNTVRVYRVTLAGAADVSGEASLAVAGLTPVAKT
ncbi:MAG: esterase-like activity of phytase family protein, partial [Thermomicrobiales bacterium]